MIDALPTSLPPHASSKLSAGFGRMSQNELYPSILTWAVGVRGLVQYHAIAKAILAVGHLIYGRQI